MLGTSLKESLKEKGIKQSFVADRIGMSPQVLGQLLNGQRKIEVGEFFAICSAAEIDPIELATEEGIYKTKAIQAQATA